MMGRYPLVTGRAPETAELINSPAAVSMRLPGYLLRAVVGVGLTSSLSAAVMTAEHSGPSRQPARAAALSACGKMAIGCPDIKLKDHEPTTSTSSTTRSSPTTDQPKRLATKPAAPHPTRTTTSPQHIVVPTTEQMVHAAGLVIAQPQLIQPGQTGIDASFPNCQDAIPQVAYGIVGITGKGFKANDCAAAEAQPLPIYSLYADAYFQKGSDEQFRSGPRACPANDQACIGYNAGYNHGVTAVNQAQQANLRARLWWVDVEPGDPWSQSPIVNDYDIEGEIDGIAATETALLHESVTVGAYSNGGMWNNVTGGLRLNVPEWLADPAVSAGQAWADCQGHSFAGGQTWMVQRITNGLDADVACRSIQP